MIIQILLIVIILWLLNLRWHQQGYMKTWNQLRNNLKTIPFVGHAYIFLGNDEDHMNVFRKIGIEAYATGGLYALWHGSRLYINVSDAIEAEFLLKNCLEKDDVMKCSRLLIGNGSVFAPVAIWRPRRKLLAPTFSLKNLTNFVEIFSRQSEIMVEQLQEAAGTGTFSIWKYITTYSMDSVCETTLGVRVNAQLKSDQPFLNAFEEICKMDGARYFQPWFHCDLVYKMTPYYRRHTIYRTFMFDFISKIIKDKRKSMEEKQDKAESEQEATERKTFLELLIEATRDKQGYTDLELREETLVLVLAGTDTSAVGTSFTAVMLSRFPEIQEKVYQEIKEVFGDSNRPITAEDLPRLKYVEAVIRETVRLFPPVPVVVRKVLDDVTLPSSGITLVKNCGIAVNIWAVNRNPKYWGEDSMEFKPERFLDAPPKEAVSFMVFSHGPRSCLGYQYAMMSMKTAVTSLVRNYKLYPAESQHKGTEMRLKFDIMMKDVDNFPVKIERRTY